jgi:hypothetical protein
VRWIVGIVCAFAVIWLGMVALRPSGTGRLNWADASCTVADAPPAPDTVVCFPEVDADTSGYLKTAQRTCEREGVARLAAYLQVRLPGPRPVSRKYARWMRAPGGRLSRTADETKLRAVYLGCLRGLRERS